MEKLTKEKTIEVAKFLTEFYGAKIIKKSDAKEMKLVAKVVSKFTKIKSDEFMKDYSTTIGNRIYLNFEIGDESKPFEDQLGTLFHELGHVLQTKTDVMMPILYLASVSDRAKYEAECWALNMEWKRYLGQPYNIQKYAERILNYGGSKNHVTMIASLLEAHEMMHNQGLSVLPIVKTAIQYFTKN